MVATGSEVATLVEGAELLAAEGISVRVVNVPSEGLFRDQPKSYQEGILPAGVVRYGLTSGLPVNLMGLVGEKGMIHGLDHFGWSAPYRCSTRSSAITVPRWRPRSRNCSADNRPGSLRRRMRGAG